MHCWPGAKKDLSSAELKWADFPQTGPTFACFLELPRTIPAPRPCPVSVCKHLSILSFLGQMPQSVPGSPALSRLSTSQKPPREGNSARNQKPSARLTQALAQGPPSHGSLKTPTPQPRTDFAPSATSSHSVTYVGASS